ncbi:MAG: undecaprenyl-diphosphate phosphatase, partial [Sphaerochaetaceae bacterium]|nr:undecaprenyl-diphosphate phosphatase [Sphaerochaetaceae bacterium]
SSSGHLILMRAIMDVPEVPLLFDVLLHMATLVVICFYYRKLIIRLLKSAYLWITGHAKDVDQSDTRLIVTIIGATIITVAMVLLFKVLDFGEYGPRGVSIAMLVCAVILATTIIPKGTGDYSQFTWKTAVFTGIAQGFGTLSGISRSGITITSSLWCQMNRKTAGEYAFVLSIPAVLGALVLAMFEDSEMVVPWFSTSDIIIACIVAAVIGFFALRLLLWMVQKAKLWYFSIYLTIIGIIGLVLLP